MSNQRIVWGGAAVPDALRNKSAQPRRRHWPLAVAALLLLLVPSILLAQPAKNCRAITAEATFRDYPTDGIRSDGNGSYEGLVDAHVCLDPDHNGDFLLNMLAKFLNLYGKWMNSTRKLTLDFCAGATDPTACAAYPKTYLPDLPFSSPVVSVGAYVRVNEVYDVISTGGAPRHLTMLFSVGGQSYGLYFDGLQGADCAKVTRVDDTAGNKTWTIKTCGGNYTARLEVNSPNHIHRKVIGLFEMPLQITVVAHEELPKSCW